MAIHVRQPVSSYDRNGIYRFLYQIWAEEFNRPISSLDHEQRIMKDELDDTAHHFIAVEQDGRVVGVVRINLLGEAGLPAPLNDYMRVSELNRHFPANSIGYASHFAVAADARGKTVASLLLAAVYQHCLELGLYGLTSYCALQYIAFYYQLGFRPYADKFRLDAGIRTPIINCIQDRGYLRQIRCPLARLGEGAGDDRGETARQLVANFPSFREPGFSKSNPQHLWARLAHSTPYDIDEQQQLFQELSPEEWKLVSKWLSELSFSQGEYIYKKGEAEPGMGILVSGSLGVEATVNGVPRIINVIGPGDVFGEIASFGGAARSVSLVALEPVEVFLMPADFLDRAARADTALGLKLAKRFIAILARRFAQLTRVIDAGLQATREAVHVQQPARYDKSWPDAIQGRVESYRFDSLGDQAGEFKRLVNQATVGQELECSMLRKIGLFDRARVLDLGSGPGVTSMILAKAFPQIKVVGVEPEDLLREKAEALIHSQNLDDRCRFLKGTGQEIPLDDQTVDFAYARLLLQHLPNPLDVLGEMRRVTRSEGVVAVFDVDDRTNLVHPAPRGVEELEQSIIAAQADAGGDRNVGRKLYHYFHSCGFENVSVIAMPITMQDLGRETFYSLVYSFKRQVLERSGNLSADAAAVFDELEQAIRHPTGFAMTTIFLAHGVVP